MSETHNGCNFCVLLLQCAVLSKMGGDGVLEWCERAFNKGDLGKGGDNS